MNSDNPSGPDTRPSARVQSHAAGANADAARVRVALVSDTHGLVRPELLRALRASDVSRILHAGDVGGSRVLEALATVAPVAAVYGNTDILDGHLPASLSLTLGAVDVHVSHGHELGSPTPARLVERYGATVIVYGHTHRALVERIGRQVVVNPGAAGPARFHLIPSFAVLMIEGGDIDVDVRPIV